MSKVKELGMPGMPGSTLNDRKNESINAYNEACFARKAYHSQELQKKDTENKKLFDSLNEEFREVERLKYELAKKDAENEELKKNIEDCANEEKLYSIVLDGLLINSKDCLIKIPNEDTKNIATALSTYIKKCLYNK